ncbi:hypothetical protein D5R81_04740 [Parashewanella spongiae]|uniref:LPP20 lipoprotein n=1 Tax=Parashewanella spongiae TaxID=342950 RepID=A0A3A6U9B5_9GAMM|nr:LPP20 family lipoprotein [Parashewanella spongiae]MCL1077296.1 LPP20 family lipoprotein [Parashewanella spongiae]RJY18526.1 hypothetical protein D5R81_04740 [Parashewanella spongiae]
MFKWLAGLPLLLVTNFAFAWPEWDMQKQEFDGYIVGQGVADSRVNAHKAALAEIASQLSININVSQTLKISKSGSTSDSEFKQKIQTTSLPFDLVGVEEIKTSSKGQQTAMLLGIKKEHLIGSLYGELSGLNRLAIPDASVEQQFIHALEHEQELHRSTQILQVLEALDGKQLKFRSELKKLKQHHQQALKQISCQIINNSIPKNVVAAIDNRLKCNGAKVIWVQPQLNWRYSDSGHIKYVEASLHIKFTHSIHPFNTLKEYNIVATSSGRSMETAKDEAINRLVIILNRPIRQWNSEQ